MLRVSLLLPAAAAALALSACATTPYTGPVEVTRFVAPAPSGLGQGPIVVYFPDEVSNSSARTAIKAAVERELQGLGYTIVAQEGPGIQVAAVRSSRTPIAAAEDRRGPVSVGVGGSTGTYGSGLGLGIGLNLSPGPKEQVATELAVSIKDRTSGTVLWEGRASFSARASTAPTS